jgi:putative ATPase
MRQLNVFEQQAREELKKQAPLADRMRPRTLDEFVGQSHLLGAGRILDRVLRAGQLQSFILWGPPGCGKTSLVRIVAENSRHHFLSLSAVAAGTKEIREAVEEARRVWAASRKRTWLFMDEIHRLNKAQQDVLLPHVEQGTLLLLGATTENPSFEIIRPLLSRAQVLVLEPLRGEEIEVLIERALVDPERGLGGTPARVAPEARGYLIAACGGDARIALNGLEMAVLTTPPGEGGRREVDLRIMQEALQRRAVHYDKAGEQHYNLISALHKSLRGSDPDASLYWLARMLEAGEEPLYIARRLVRMASEDVGLADPLALVQALSAFQTYQVLGSPEGELALAQAVVYLALAPKSNAVYTSFDKAREVAAKTGTAPVPLHLRNAPTRLLRDLDYGRDYRYPHDDPQGWVPEVYFPDDLAGTLFYHPTGRGWEGGWRELLTQRRKRTNAGK